MTASVSHPSTSVEQRGTTSRLLVSRRDADTRQYQCVGFLSYLHGRYRFAYLRSHAEDPTFRAVPGFADVHRIYESERLFPIFAERVMSPRRPDREFVLRALGLGLDAEPFEVLARSGGRRVGDTIELVPVPVPDDDGFVSVDYFVHGVRYMSAEAQRRITGLHEGDQLTLVPDPENEVESRAVLVTDDGELRLGYVPTPLLDVIHAIDGPKSVVLQANAPDVGFHYRLLVRTSGVLVGKADPFEGQAWATTE